METMNWIKMLKPTRWKVVFSLTPLIFPLVQSLGEIFLTSEPSLYNLLFNIFPIDVALALTSPIDIILFIETVISRPFEPLLRPLGWWSRDSIFVGPSGPLLPGSFVVAITYAILIYVTFSLFSFLRDRRDNT